MTKTKRSEKATSLNLKKAHAVLREKGQFTRDSVIEILQNSDQPLVAREVQALLAKRRVVLDGSYVKTLLNKLQADGLIVSREESPTEHAIRRGADGRGAHLKTVYYWAGSNKVPARTVQTVVQTGNIPFRSPKKKLKKKTGRPAKAAKKQTGTTSTEVAVLVARIVELEQQLAEIRKITR
jgi:hypothetical protein